MAGEAKRVGCVPGDVEGGTVGVSEGERSSGNMAHESGLGGASSGVGRRGRGRDEAETRAVSEGGRGRDVGSWSGGGRVVNGSVCVRSTSVVV